MCLLLGWGLHPDNQIVVKNCELPQVLTTNDAGSNFILPSEPPQSVENHYDHKNITINVYIENEPKEDDYVFCEVYPYDSSCVQDIPDDLHEVISEDDDIVINESDDKTITKEKFEEGETRPPRDVEPEDNEGTIAPEVDEPTYDSDAKISLNVKKGK